MTRCVFTSVYIWAWSPRLSRSFLRRGLSSSGGGRGGSGEFIYWLKPSPQVGTRSMKTVQKPFRSKLPWTSQHPLLHLDLCGSPTWIFYSTVAIFQPFSRKCSLAYVHKSIQINIGNINKQKTQEEHKTFQNNLWGTQDISRQLERNSRHF